MFLAIESIVLTAVHIADVLCVPNGLTVFFFDLAALIPLCRSCLLICLLLDWLVCGNKSIARRLTVSVLLFQLVLSTSTTAAAVGIV